MRYSLDNGQTWIPFTIKALDGMPIGAVILFAGTTIPTSWLICDGAEYDDEVYPELHEVLGGTGLKFNVPDMRGRVPVGYDTNDTDFNAIGKTGGSKYLQEHSHLLKFNGGSVADSSSPFAVNKPVIQGDWYNVYTEGWVQNAGTGDSGNLQPYYTINYIIKAKNTTPTMASVVNTKNNSTEDTYSCKFVNDELDKKQDELTNIYIGSQTICYHYNRSNAHLNETVYGAYDYQLINGIFVGITVPQGYHKAYRLTASGTNNNGEGVYVWINNISTNKLTTYSSTSFRVIVSSPIFKESDIVLEPTFNYTHTLGTNLKVTSTGTTSVDLVDITIHGYLQKD